jgi:putative FmdB family regulatory protein
MPIYEYRCEECDSQFQLFVRSVSRQVETTCPGCGSHKVKKAISLFGLGKPRAGATMSASCDTGST